MFKQEIEEFLKDIDKDKVRTNLDENSMSISIGCDLNHIEAEKIRTMIKNKNCEYKICTIHTCTAYNQFIELTRSIIDFTIEHLPEEYSLLFQ